MSALRLGSLNAAAAPLRPVVLAMAVLLVACGQGDKKAEGAPAKAGGGMPPPEVGVVVATPGDIGLVTELPGRLEASRVAEVRARAAGILQRRLFKEGSDVKAGQPLFAIDAAPYQATYQSAQAQVLRAQAAVTRTTEVAKRYEPLVAANAISKQDYADAVAARAQAEADLAVAKASVQTAKISLDYAAVTAPISGRIGRALVTEGALVGQGEATPLAVVQQINPLYVNFTQSASEALRLRRAMEAGTLKRAGGGEAASVRILLEDGTAYALPGKLLFSDLTVDTTTGQITLRAEVPNPKGDLLPGLYVRVQIEQAQASNAIAVPQQAVTRTETGNTLTVVSADGKMEKRSVKITAGQNNRWIVTEGLKAGEQVMVDGFQKLMMMPPGAPVKAVPWQAAGAAPAAPAASAPKQ
ncbi:efflux RND transporter periplasmic adaptor subunit [Pseudorhodoferax sp.]|uniref:efflux RND transporter periplasmic adaptor subunit n=1 Tax=Pseudorhodoferax sp. TaxID=1993553 RepID=UPI002DD6889D|nr:efflux RND transporter periplasmic adaptor subunit [Pseudorhodoferax sp.]